MLRKRKEVLGRSGKGGGVEEEGGIAIGEGEGCVVVKFLCIKSLKLGVSSYRS